jgi:hypothetical protein
MSESEPRVTFATGATKLLKLDTHPSKNLAVAVGTGMYMYDFVTCSASCKLTFFYLILQATFLWRVNPHG